MIATGIVRRIDDLGRLVVPKEIRRKLEIREGDALELFYTEDSVVFKKYRDVSLKERLKRLSEDIADDQNIDGYLKGRIYEKLCSALEIFPDED